MHDPLTFLTVSHDTDVTPRSPCDPESYCCCSSAVDGPHATRIIVGQHEASQETDEARDPPWTTYNLNLMNRANASADSVHFTSGSTKPWMVDTNRGLVCVYAR